MNPKLKEVGSRVQQARKKLKLSQAELAEMVQISTSHLSDIENGKTNIGLDIFISLTEALQVSADWLLQTNVPQVNTIQNQEASEILEVHAEELIIPLNAKNSVHNSSLPSIPKEQNNG